MSINYEEFSVRRQENMETIHKVEEMLYDFQNTTLKKLKFFPKREALEVLDTMRDIVATSKSTMDDLDLLYKTTADLVKEVEELKSKK